MAYCRRDGKTSDVYILLSIYGHLECCGCTLEDTDKFATYSALFSHIQKHEEKGHRVPIHAITQLINEQEQASDDVRYWFKKL